MTAWAPLKNLIESRRKINMKFKKAILSITTISSIIVPLATVVACESKTDELVFDDSNQTSREFTIDKNKDLQTRVIKPYENIFATIGGLVPKDNKFVKTNLTMTEEFLKKLDDAKEEAKKINDEFIRFNHEIVDTKYNILDNTYLKALDYIDQKDSNNKVQKGLFNINYEAKRINLLGYYAGITAGILKELVAYSDTRTSDKNNVTQNHFFMDDAYIKSNLTAEDANNWKGDWADAITLKKEELENSLANDYKLAHEPIEIATAKSWIRLDAAKKLNEFANNAIVVYGKNVNGKETSLAGDVNVIVERGAAATHEDINNALNKLSDSNGKAVTWINVGDQQTNTDINWFKKDEFYLPKAKVSDAFAVLKAKQQEVFIDEYKVYLEKETGKTFANEHELYIRNATDYYKLVEIVAKSVTAGRDALQKLSPIVFEPMTNNAIFQNAIKNLGIGGLVTVVSKDADVVSTSVVSNGTLVISRVGTPWEEFKLETIDSSKISAAFRDALLNIATNYGEKGFKAALKSVSIAGLDYTGAFGWQSIESFKQTDPTIKKDWKAELADYIRL